MASILVASSSCAMRPSSEVAGPITVASVLLVALTNTIAPRDALHDPIMRDNAVVYEAQQLSIDNTDRATSSALNASVLVSPTKLLDNGRPAEHRQVD